MNNLENIGEWDGVEFFPIPHHEGYAVSKCGKIRSLDRIAKRDDGRRQPLKGKERTCSINSAGYKVVIFSRGKSKAQWLVHRVVAMTFIGGIEGRHVDHIDRNPLNNNVANLRVTNYSGNGHNRIATGVYVMKHGKWKAQIKDGGVSRHIGMFDTREEARSAYKEAKRALLGWFPA